jgi:hypothetical protein
MLRTATQWLIDASATGMDRFYVRTSLTVQNVVRSGLTPSYSAANVDGHGIPNSGAEFLHVKTGGTGTTVTIPIPGTVDGQAVASKTVVLGTSTERMIGPFPPGTYNQASGEVHIDFSSVTTVTVAAIKGGG